VTLAVLTDDAI